jgi:hypothetical protein
LYRELIGGLEEPNETENFRQKINICWLYCPDDVIQKGTDLLSMLNDEGRTNEEKENAVSAFMLTIRKDALKRWPWHYVRPPTELNRDDFKTWKRIRHLQLKAEGGKISISSKIGADLTLRNKNGKEK